MYSKYLSQIGLDLVDKAYGSLPEATPDDFFNKNVKPYYPEGSTSPGVRREGDYGSAADVE